MSSNVVYQVYDLHAAALLESNTSVHNQSVFGLEMKPDKTGFVTVSADKKIAFWDFALVDNDEGTGKRLSIEVPPSHELHHFLRFITGAIMSLA